MLVANGIAICLFFNNNNSRSFILFYFIYLFVLKHTKYASKHHTSRFYARTRTDMSNDCNVQFTKQYNITIDYNHRRNNRGDRGRLDPQHLGWGTNNVLAPNFLLFARIYTSSGAH